MELHIKKWQVSFALGLLLCPIVLNTYTAVADTMEDQSTQAIEAPHKAEQTESQEEPEFEAEMPEPAAEESRQPTEQIVTDSVNELARTPIPVESEVSEGTDLPQTELFGSTVPSKPLETTDIGLAVVLDHPEIPLGTKISGKIYFWNTGRNAAVNTYNHLTTIDELRKEPLKIATYEEKPVYAQMIEISSSEGIGKAKEVACQVKLYYVEDDSNQNNETAILYNLTATIDIYEQKTIYSGACADDSITRTVGTAVDPLTNFAASSARKKEVHSFGADGEEIIDQQVLGDDAIKLIYPDGTLVEDISTLAAGTFDVMYGYDDGESIHPLADTAFTLELVEPQTNLTVDMILNVPEYDEVSYTQGEHLNYFFGSDLTVNLLVNDGQKEETAYPSWANDNWQHVYGTANKLPGSEIIKARVLIDKGGLAEVTGAVCIPITYTLEYVIQRYSEKTNQYEDVPGAAGRTSRTKNVDVYTEYSADGEQTITLSNQAAAGYVEVLRDSDFSFNYLINSVTEQKVKVYADGSESPFEKKSYWGEWNLKLYDCDSGEYVDESDLILSGDKSDFVIRTFDDEGKMMGESTRFTLAVIDPDLEMSGSITLNRTEDEFYAEVYYINRLASVDKASISIKGEEHDLRISESFAEIYADSEWRVSARVNLRDADDSGVLWNAKPTNGFADYTVEYLLERKNSEGWYQIQGVKTLAKARIYLKSYTQEVKFMAEMKNTWEDGVIATIVGSDYDLTQHLQVYRDNMKVFANEEDNKMYNRPTDLTEDDYTFQLLQGDQPYEIDFAKRGEHHDLRYSVTLKRETPETSWLPAEPFETEPFSVRVGSDVVLEVQDIEYTIGDKFDLSEGIVTAMVDEEDVSHLLGTKGSFYLTYDADPNNLEAGTAFEVTATLYPNVNDTIASREITVDEPVTATFMVNVKAAPEKPKNGEDGKPGQDGQAGKDGQPGKDGLNGKDADGPKPSQLAATGGNAVTNGTTVNGTAAAEKNLPATGDSSNIWLTVLGTVVLGTGAAFLLLKKKFTK